MELDTVIGKGTDIEVCPLCGDRLVPQDGCHMCFSCGWSACSN